MKFRVTDSWPTLLDLDLPDVTPPDVDAVFDRERIAVALAEVERCYAQDRPATDW